VIELPYSSTPRCGPARMTAPLARGRLSSSRVESDDMTFIWFIVWLIANNVGDNEPLALDPVNAWVATLILAVALDLSAAHASRVTPSR
jgi:hypothetical protein